MLHIGMPTAVDVPLRTDDGDVIRVGNIRVTLRSVIEDFHQGASQYLSDKPNGMSA